MSGLLVLNFVDKSTRNKIIFESKSYKIQQRPGVGWCNNPITRPGVGWSQNNLIQRSVGVGWNRNNLSISAAHQVPPGMQVDC